VTRVIFVVFSEKDETMYRKGTTVQFPPPDNDEETGTVDEEAAQEKKKK
jgi:hypothetical protein